jgi:hypothetical protein
MWDTPTSPKAILNDFRTSRSCPSSRSTKTTGAFPPDPSSLPSRRPKTLTELTLQHSTVPSLHPFINLQTLRAKPGKALEWMSNMLKSHDGSLRAFTVQLVRIASCQAIGIGTGCSANVYSSWRISKWNSDRAGYYLREWIQWRSMCSVICMSWAEWRESLPLLRDVVFWAGLEVGETRLLGSLKDLERLSWNCPLGCVVGLDSYEVGFNDRVVQRVFQDIPGIKVVGHFWTRALGSEGYGLWHDCISVGNLSAPASPLQIQPQSLFISTNSYLKVPQYGGGVIQRERGSHTHLSCQPQPRHLLLFIPIL